MHEYAASDNTGNLKPDTTTILEKASADSQVSRLSDSEKIKDNATNPLHILKVRFAKGEISKEEYEEMRRLLE